MSTVLVRQIQSYKVIVQRSLGSPARRLLRLALKPRRGNPVKTADLVFEARPRSLGDLGDSTPLLRLPLEDFEDCYHVLQTEKPVHLAASTGPTGKVIYVGLTSDPEALGEGFKDSDA